MVRTANSRRLIDSSPGTHDAQVVLVILVANQLLIKIADPIENIAVPAAVDHSVNIAFIVRTMGARAADRKGRMEDSPNGPLHILQGGSPHRTTDIVCSGFTQDR